MITATPFVRDKFLASGKIDWIQKKNHVCYVGSIGRIRAILEVVQAMNTTQTDVRLQLAGRFSESKVEKTAHAEVGWNKVDALDF